MGGRDRTGAVIRDKIAYYEKLLAWSVLAEASRAAARVSSRVWLHSAVLHRELSVARSHQRLAVQGSRFVWTFPEQPDAPDRILWPVPLSAAELLTSGDLARLGQCGGENCGWMFLDTSRNHRRQWCDMQDCGNRAKVQRFRQKRRDPG